MSGPSKNDVTDIAINSCPQKSVQSPLPHTLHLVGALHVVDDPGRGPPHIPNGAGDLAGIAVFMGGTIEGSIDNLRAFLPDKQMESLIVEYCAMPCKCMVAQMILSQEALSLQATVPKGPPQTTHQPAHLD